MTDSRPLSILVVFTGGTIASRYSDGKLTLNKAPFGLLEGVLPDKYVCKTIEPIQTLSENMTPAMLFNLFRAIYAEVSGNVFDGIIIAHGTDTLAYTAQTADILLAELGIPVVLLGSKYPLGEPGSDGQANFNNALALIRQEKSGVFVVSRTDRGIDCVYSAGEIMQADSRTDDFQSYKGQLAGIMKEEVFHHTAGESLSHTRRPHSCRKRLQALTEIPAQQTVLVLDACIGMNYQVLDLSRPEYIFILQRLYHSGTACTAPHSSPYSLVSLQNLCQKNGKTLFIAPIEKSRIPYSTTLELLEAGITPVYDRPFEAVWAGLLVCTWLNEKPEDFFRISG